MTIPTPMIQPGHIIYNSVNGNQYVLNGKIGNGGFGEVYLAYDRQFGNRKVAVKRLTEGGKRVHGTTELAFKKINQEACLVQSLNNKYIPKIHEYFFDMHDWEYYMIMEYIDGKMLLTYQKEKGGFLLVQEALVICEQLTSVFSHLHTNNVIHRDLKPDNVMVSGDQIFLIDFGLAKRLQSLFDITSVRVGHLYAAPEIRDGGIVTPKSDIYSLGIVLYEMLTGFPSHPADMRTDMLKIRQKDLPPGLEQFIRRMVAEDSRNRPNSMHDVRQAIEHFEQAIEQSEKVGGRTTQQIIRQQIINMIDSCHMFKQDELTKMQQTIVSMTESFPFEQFPFDYMESKIRQLIVHSTARKILLSIRSDVLDKYLKVKHCDKVREQKIKNDIYRRILIEF